MFAAIEKFIGERSLLHFTGHKRQVLKGRLHERTALLGLPDLASYLDLLHGSGAEEAALMDLITTNETFFFRNLPQFKFLMEKIVPGIEVRRGRDVIRSWGQDAPSPAASIMKLRILCAGCSTGEEPYSVAMALLESLRYPKAWDVEILAGDLSHSCLKKAETGFYGEDRLKGLPTSFREKYLEPVEGGAMIREEVKRLVRFFPFNLLAVVNGDPLPVEAGFCGFDLIFCRNVMIYFSVDSQQRLVNALYDLLMPGGFFFTGDAEALHIYHHGFRVVRDAECLVYTKLEKNEDGEATSQ
ncbi:protein-glutamate O-methyltransferase CheR [Geotalea sp. SG265]|uniref:CheR family methyltransferase n=1 Tax=Geotalea sp. SG265 TaxID=2922867 RepID=UPI001FB02641|nr:protein-glutamate O-methyltransferase CheR [Geotalea sp. SG265]